MTEGTQSEAAAGTLAELRKGYPGLDVFRLVAALMVIAIHTSPLDGISAGADFWLCRVLCRVAVPFFLTVTGMFLSREVRIRRIRSFLLRMAGLYGLSLVLYLPVKVYGGYFEQPGVFSRFLKDLLVEGMMYHLWYFPAVILGVLIVAPLWRFFGRRTAAAVGGVLYLIGLLGDSYYGLALKLPGGEAFFRGVFTVFDYTRNGLFFVPLFLALGGLISGSRRPGRWVSFGGCVVSLALMSAEALWLRRLGWQRHDSMYIWLIPLTVCLVWFLCSFEGGRRKRDARCAAMIYLLHPGVIIGVRGAGHLLGAEAALCDNALIQFFTVAAVTCALAVGLCRVPDLFRRGLRDGGRRAWAEIDLGAIRENGRMLCGLLPGGCRMMAVVKADAYGHGAVKVARALRREGVRTFAVATLKEGVTLRRHGIRGEILILGRTEPVWAGRLYRYRLSQAVTDLAYARQLRDTEYPVRCHVAVDTGMHRLGISYETPEIGAVIATLAPLHVVGVFSHLCCVEDRAFTLCQMERFEAFREKLTAMGVRIPKWHIWNSQAVLCYGDTCAYDLARVGISLFGIGDGRLLPTLSFHARVAQVRSLGAGEALGYGLIYRTERESLVAVVTAGYADGIPRDASRLGVQVLIRGVRCPVVGRVCMDQLTVDVTDCPFVTAGDAVTLIGRDGGQAISVSEVAGWLGTIENDVFCRIGPRVERMYTDNTKKRKKQQKRKNK